MNSLAKLEAVTVEDYLAFEQQSEIRHEYLAGELYAMAGGSRRHNLLALGLATRLQAHT